MILYSFQMLPVNTEKIMIYYKFYFINLFILYLYYTITVLYLYNLYYIKVISNP